MPKSLGCVLKEIREISGWTQERLLGVVPINADTLSRLENDEGDPKLSTVLQVTAALAQLTARNALAEYAEALVAERLAEQQDGERSSGTPAASSARPSPHGGAAMPDDPQRQEQDFVDRLRASLIRLRDDPDRQRLLVSFTDAQATKLLQELDEERRRKSSAETGTG